MIYLLRRDIVNGINSFSIVDTIGNITASLGSTDWRIPVMPSGSNYFIQVGCPSGYSFPQGCGGNIMSANPFTITGATPTPTPIYPTPTPTVRVTTPNGGEQWIEGTTRTITWDASNVDSANMFGVRLKKSGQIVQGTYVYPATTGIRSVPFTVPRYSSGNDCRVEVVLYSDSRMVNIIASDQSDQNFTIAQTPTPTPIYPTPTPSLSPTPVPTWTPTLMLYRNPTSPATGTVINPGQRQAKLMTVDFLANGDAKFAQISVCVSNGTSSKFTGLSNITIRDDATGASIGSVAALTNYDASRMCTWGSINFPAIFIHSGNVKALSVLADVSATASAGTIKPGIVGMAGDASGGFPRISGLDLWGNNLSIVSSVSPRITEPPIIEGNAGGSGSQVAGVATAVTFTRNLKLGMRGDDVTVLQQILARLGLLSAKAITGYFGALTEQAVKDFQWKHNIISTGLVGEVTRDVLNAMVAQ
jgi:hypothetical protein